MAPNKKKGSTSLSLFSGKTKGDRPFEKRGSLYETMRKSNGPGSSKQYLEVWGDGEEKNNSDEQVLVNLSNKVSARSGIASARRFLWGEDEEEMLIAQMGQASSSTNTPQPPRRSSVNSLFGGDPRTSFGSNDKAINLMAPPIRSDHSSAPPPASAFSFFNRQTTEFNDAADYLGEPEEYLSKRNRSQHFAGTVRDSTHRSGDYIGAVLGDS
jgi:hypothetical protein